LLFSRRNLPHSIENMLPLGENRFLFGSPDFCAELRGAVDIERLVELSRQIGDRTFNWAGVRPLSRNTLAAWPGASSRNSIVTTMRHPLASLATSAASASLGMSHCASSATTP
jgi:hypothetical protein